jgi:predicted TIM-barrel fold metal-dependent hydrolase
MEQPGSPSAAEIRASLPHPVVDGDGHLIEYLPALAGYLREEGVDPAGPTIQRLLPGRFGPDADWYAASPEDRARLRIARPPWWGAPAENTRDLATALFPSLLHERLDEFGIDVSVVYPSMGLAFLHLEDADERTGACRALNRYCREQFEPYADRLVPVAAIPMHSPKEAVEALDHAVQVLGFKAVLLAGYVQRSVEGVPAEASPWARWIDTYGLDSAHDYDPVWARCRDLQVSVAFHSGSIGWGSRVSPSNYMLNHIGHLAEGQHALAKSLFLGGVTRRFPELRFAFLEGGVAWAAALYADLVGHWEKRNRRAMAHLDPAGIDRALLLELVGAHAPKADVDPALSTLPRRTEDPAHLDEFAACGIESAEDIAELFATPFSFGCEADDPMVRTAFDTQANPFGVKLKAVFGSDIAHWDVPDMAGVLGEARELVEHGLIDEAAFRDFVFTHPVRFFTDVNPQFFEGTVVADAVRELNAAP